ncbi:MAG: NAD(P)/FAD-dependent oxidoreductase [Sphingomonadales bacterium]
MCQPVPHTLVVIGGGAAGLFCAVNAARMAPSLQVIVVEKSSKLLAKVKVSGGGRCNVTHACFDRLDLPGYYPRGAPFVKRYQHSFFTTDTIEWFAARQVNLKTEADGRMFPVSDNSQTIIDVLLHEAALYGVQIRLKTGVQRIESSMSSLSSPFIVHTQSGESIVADFCCIACGGFTQAASFDWIRQLGHSIEDPVPSLFTFNAPKHPIVSLQGVSVPAVSVKISGTKLVQTGPLLITHWGLSGPAILKLSAYGARELADRNYSFDIQVNWLGRSDHSAASVSVYMAEQRRQHPAQKISNGKLPVIPQRLWEFFLGQATIAPDQRWADLSRREENLLIRLLTDMSIHIEGKTTFKEEFVTAGGVMLAEIDSATMMSKKVAHLYFAGEIMNVDGITGGFNFQHAWSSGMLAARAIAAAQGQMGQGGRTEI